MIVIDRLAPADVPQVLALLERSGLPLDGFSDHATTALVARDEGSVVGSAALEVRDDVALLRSVAVDAARRGQGLGQRLTDAALRLARQRGVQSVYLLTETADEFFARRGFRPIERGAVATAIHQSAEWSCACSQRARVMHLRIS